MITKKKPEDNLDVSSILENYEEKPIVPVEPSSIETTAGKEKAVVKKEEGTEDRFEDTVVEERLKEDLKMSYKASGILDITFGGYGFLRQDYILNPDKDIYVSTSQIRRFWLRRGDEVEGLARPPKEGERFHSLLLIKKINGEELTEEQSRLRKQFDQLTSLHPNKQIKLETEKDILSTRIMDLLSPIGFGQRALIVSQPKAGKTTFLKDIAEAMGKNYPDVFLMAILIGERPEEVTEIKRFIKGETAASNFDESPRQQVKVANLALDRARRLVEMGKKVVILLDSVTRLARAYNLSVSGTGRSLSGGFDPQALYPAKKFLGAARNCEEGGSLTIIGTALVGTESRMDDLIYEEFKGTGNMEVHLERKFADRRIYPAIDVAKSGTRHEELLFDKEMLRKITTLRRMLGLLNDEEQLTAMIEKLSKTKDNKEFLTTLNAAS
ncbi:transcription termination factor Rho [Candidatus Roizmanbacteria bacterium RIFCSPHIGHO2_02_FULL_37_15]|uniref:Transcription termination factor Rho n=1 Tax=Candidatus Roizmanbacteria bacterium RIFCSPLOWO2_01_FULL_37_16 TaxID=1802058 RepID=A0A1F7IMJ5_9BACT|nr:MAG: transcription termination factor Rho [Candidatus Roizmanbacteria bacterium RIFCSPHIGHO2_01_FULL_37_16b]OGK22478.1 MAG: transcription termination factor Rho [Candidatus Roizmanbacteria bacterium RIFCSPHIGHO2_02_FULL_37_15]OGK33538.1 MAG: transcription termination factor Rho [Candidatus Roizmanbacteria bacterium RIFCSPHIGHO2_12_FULL_36_11]OGK44594.1 MAG: transcription termination factor Rho [Candidatus Roizmanbacteria bacterium RIFCSPLOWO2_01_FULL_37_16]